MRSSRGCGWILAECGWYLGELWRRSSQVCIKSSRVWMTSSLARMRSLAQCGWNLAEYGWDLAGLCSIQVIILQTLINVGLFTVLKNRSRTILFKLFKDSIQCRLCSREIFRTREELHTHGNPKAKFLRWTKFSVTYIWFGWLAEYFTAS
jgi:hypothetical protein